MLFSIFSFGSVFYLMFARFAWQWLYVSVCILCGLLCCALRMFFFLIVTACVFRTEKLGFNIELEADDDAIPGFVHVGLLFFI